MDLQMTETTPESNNFTRKKHDSTSKKWCPGKFYKFWITWSINMFFKLFGHKCTPNYLKMVTNHVFESNEKFRVFENVYAYKSWFRDCWCTGLSQNDDVNYSLKLGPVRPKTTLPGRHYTAFCNALWIPRISPKHGLCRRSYLGYQKRDGDEILILWGTILEVSSCAISAPKHLQTAENKKGN